MHESASTFVDNWSDLIAEILGDLDLDKLAFSTRALRRRRGVRNALALLRLALARGPGGLSLRDAAAWAHMAQVRRTDRRLAQRSSASIVRISGGGRGGDVAGQDAGLLLSMARPDSSDFGWQLRQQA